MDYFLSITGALIMLVVLAAGWLLTVLGLPGNWLIVAATAIFALLVPASWRTDISGLVVVAVVVLAVVGELLEFAAGAMGTSRAGGSKRAAALALVGSMIGAVVGAVVGLPIPVVGSFVAVLLFAAAGATGGAMIGESWKRRTLDEGWEVGKGAFWGRLLGTLGKILVGSVIVAVVALALVVA